LIVAIDTQLSIFATKRGQLPSVRDVKEYRYTEDSKDQGVCHGARCVGVLLRAMHIHIAIFGNYAQ